MTDSFCLCVICDHLKLIWLPRFNFTLKSLIVFNRMHFLSGIFVLDLIHQWNSSEVEFMKGDKKDPSERHLFLILLAPLIKECCPVSPYSQKTTHMGSVCINLDCMRMEFFSVSARWFWRFTLLCFCITN